MYFQVLFKTVIYHGLKTRKNLCSSFPCFDTIPTSAYNLVAFLPPFLIFHQVFKCMDALLQNLVNHNNM